MSEPLDENGKLDPHFVAPKQTLSDADKTLLENAKMRRQLAVLEAEKADLTYRNVILQVYMKNGLGPEDAIGENYEIIPGGAKAAQGQ